MHIQRSVTVRQTANTLKHDNGQRLVLFTLEYPYGKAETFLESEIQFLSQRFRQVYVVPTSNKSDIKKRTTPPNVVVIDEVAEIENRYTLVSFIPFALDFIVIWIFSFWHSGKRGNYLRFIRSLMHHFYNDVSKKEAIDAVIRKYSLAEALFYDYWFSNSSLSLLLLKRQGKIRQVVCRAHRFDLYDEVVAEGIIAFREWKVAALDRIFTISMHGQRYLLDRIQPVYRNKVDIAYLGVEKPGNVPNTSGDVLVVSCSNMLEVKQVDKIALALRLVKVPFRWIHFGDGPGFQQVQQIAETFPKEIQVDLRGFITNEDLLRFYSENYVTCFISLSVSEGLPVSMMEAQSVGIPIIAPSINGIPEIVNAQTGYLLRDDYTVGEVARVVENILKGDLSFDRDRIRQYYSEHFNASKNYQRFAETLARLNE